jgi:outer membrane receptor protein involved in Fe transport
MKPRICAHALATAISAAFAFPAAAQEMQKIEVTGAKVDQRREETAARIVLSGQDLQRQGDRTLADVLQRVAGVSIGAGAGKGSEIRMRGLGNGYTQILLNGVAAPQGFAVESLAPELIEKVEILRSASAELGTQAIAGTINIILRKSAPRARQEGKLGLDALAGGLHPNLSPNLSWQAADKGDGYSYTVAATANRTAAPVSRVEYETLTAPDGALALSRISPQRDSNVSRAASVAPRVSWKQGDDTVSVQSFLNLYERSMGVEAHETVLAGPPSQFPDNGRLVVLRGALLRTDLSWQRALESGARWEAKLGFTVNPRSSDFEFHTLAGGVRSPELKVVHADIGELAATFSGKYQLPLGGGHALAAGWDSGRTRRTQTREEQDYTSGMAYDERHRGVVKRVALYAQDDWELGRGWSLSAGVRWEALETAVSTAVATASTLRPADAIVQRSPVLSPVLQSLYKLSAQRQFRLGLARTYKAPTMAELIPRRYTTDNNNSATNPDTQGNPRLRPELAWGLDAGYDHYFGKDGLFSASAYARRIDGVTLPLLFREGGRWIRMPSNAGRADARGVALEAKAALSDAWSLRGNLARNWSRVAGVPGPDNRLDRQAPFSLNAGADWQTLPSLKMGADFNYERGARTQLSATEASAAGSVRKLDLYAVWQLDGAMRLRVGALNLLRRDMTGWDSAAVAEGVQRLLTRTAASPTLRVGLERNW